MAAYTTIDDPEKYFQVKLTTGTGSSQAVTFDGDTDMQPDLIWGKRRDSTGHHSLFDSVRGITKGIEANNNGAEWTSTDYYSSFDSDGFTIAAGSSGAGNGSSQTAVQWCWKESADAGFDIVSWTGNGSSQNISHSLSAVPHFMITKNRSATGDWSTYHKYGGGTKTFYLSNTDAIGTTSSPWNDTTPTSSVFSVGGGAYTNGDGNSIIGYLWTEKQGYSKFGSYKGNGNADGPFIYTGFQPALIIAKESSEARDWQIWDNKRLGYNASGGNKNLIPNKTDAEDTYADIDILSNGFKLRSTSSAHNKSAQTYIYIAFAEAPFVNSNGVPCNAR